MGCPVFPGNTGVDQLVEIIKVLGAPNKEDLRRMNPTYQEFKFPKIRAHNFVHLFPAGTDSEAIDVVASLLKYLPESRSTAIQLVFSDFFLPKFCARDYKLPNGEVLPASFFTFTPEEKESAATAGFTHALLNQNGNDSGNKKSPVRQVSDDSLNLEADEGETTRLMQAPPYVQISF